LQREQLHLHPIPIHFQPQPAVQPRRSPRRRQRQLHRRPPAARIRAIRRTAVNHRRPGGGDDIFGRRRVRAGHRRGTAGATPAAAAHLPLVGDVHLVRGLLLGLGQRTDAHLATVQLQPKFLRQQQRTRTQEFFKSGAESCAQKPSPSPADESLQAPAPLRVLGIEHHIGRRIGATAAEHSDAFGSAAQPRRGPLARGPATALRGTERRRRRRCLVSGSRQE